MFVISSPRSKKKKICKTSECKIPVALTPEHAAPANTRSASQQAVVLLLVTGTVRDGLEMIRIDFMAIS